MRRGYPGFMPVFIMNVEMYTRSPQYKLVFPVVVITITEKLKSDTPLYPPATARRDARRGSLICFLVSTYTTLAEVSVLKFGKR